MDGALLSHLRSTEHSNDMHASLDRRPTICHVLFSMEVGGAEMLAKELAEAGSDRFRSVFACLDTIGELGEALLQAGYIVESMHRRPGVSVGCAKRLRAFFDTHNVDVVHAHHCGPFRHAAIARLFRKPTPILITEHGRPFSYVKSRRRSAINKLLLRKNDRVIAVGECMRTPLTIDEGIPKRCIEVIHNGRDLRKYASSAALRSTARQALGVTESEFVTIQVARLSPEKDHATSIRAIAHLQSEYPSLRHIIVGDGPNRLFIERLIAELGLAHHIRLLGSRRDVAQLLPGADAFVLSSTSEAIPLTLIEAMASGLPCVASRVGGIPEVVAHNETGLLADPGDALAFAGHLKTLMDSRQLCDKMRSAARKRAEAMFDKSRMEMRYFTAYEQMLVRL